jgi:hypothetical protein
MIINDFFKFLISGKYQKYVKEKISQRMVDFIILFFVVFFLSQLSAKMLSYLHLENYKPQSLNSKRIIYSILIVLIIEELTSRLWLVHNKLNFTISISLMISALISLWVDVGIITFTFLLIFLTISILLYTIIFYLFKLNSFLEEFWNKKFLYIFYLTSITFWFLHAIRNKEFIPILIISSFYAFIAGLFYGYARMKFGFIYAIIAHSMFNSIFVLVTIFRN